MALTATITRVANVAEVSFSWAAPTLRIHWTGTGDSYSVDYRETGTDAYTNVTGTDDTGIDITGLAEGKHYEFSITTTLGAVSSLSDDYAYGIMPAGSTAPTGCNVEAETPTSITISWVGTGNFVVRWEAETGDADYLETTANMVTIGGLNPRLFYTIVVGTDTGTGILYGDCILEKTTACCEGSDSVNQTEG